MSIRIFLSSAIVRRMVIVTYMHMYAFYKKLCYMLDIISYKPHGVPDISEEISN